MSNGFLSGSLAARGWVFEWLKLSQPNPNDLGYVDSVSVEEIGSVRCSGSSPRVDEAISTHVSFYSCTCTAQQAIKLADGDVSRIFPKK
ncbi:hypothetical protein FCV25MIE_08136 [Fagus crenata]